MRNLSSLPPWPQRRVSTLPEQVKENFLFKCTRNNHNHNLVASYLTSKPFILGKEIPDIYNATLKKVIFFQGCYYHPHLNPKCRSYPNMVKRFTKEGKSCQDYVDKFEHRMTLMKQNYPDLVKSHQVVYECNFVDFLNGKYSPEFDKTFRESELFKKQFFSRLVPRDACLPDQIQPW